MGRKKTSNQSKKKARNDDFSLETGDHESKLIVAVSHKNEGQKLALKTISENKVTILHGVPGSGKTWISVAWALQEMIMHNRFQRIIFTRPIVEAGESLGYLPGDAQSKVAPYMMPMYDVVSSFLSDASIEAMIKTKQIVVMPLAYMRGVTIKNACLIADEMQNSTCEQMHLLLTRIGENSKIIITGDTEQSDLSYHKNNPNKLNGLADAIDKLVGINNLGIVELGYASCVRDKIVSEIDARYRKKKATLISMPEPKNNNRENQDEGSFLDEV